MVMLLKWPVSDRPGIAENMEGARIASLAPKGKAQIAARSDKQEKGTARPYRSHPLPVRNAGKTPYFGGSAIIAVHWVSAHSLPSIIALPENLQIEPRTCVNSTWKSTRCPGSTGERNFAPSIAMK